MDKLVSIIIVNFNNYHYTLDCIKSLLNQSYQNFEIIIIDNCSKNNLYLKLKKRIKQFEKDLDIKLIRCNYNLYFAGGNNKAIKISKGKYIFLLNSDTIVLPDFLEKMVDFLEKNEDAGMIAPKIKVYKNKNYIWYAGANLNFRNFSLASHRGVWEYDPYNQKYSDISITDYANGAALCLKREVIDKIGLLDDIFFMYFEEIDWNLRARKEGYKIYYVPTTIVYHKVSRILDKRKNFFKTFFKSRNAQIFVWKHAKLNDLLIFYLKYSFVCIRTLLVALKNKKFIWLILLFHSILQGFLIGVKRRTNHSCRRNLIKNYNFIQYKLKKLNF